MILGNLRLWPKNVRCLKNAKNKSVKSYYSEMRFEIGVFRFLLLCKKTSNI